jgi:cytochrome bd-type quinol oxidase subunit 2
MINKIKTLMLSLSTLVALALPAVMPASVLAANTNIHGGLCQGADINVTPTPSDAACNTSDVSGNNINNKIAKIINWLSAIIGVVAVIMIIFGGFRYITSGGNDSSVASAKKTILFALIGLVIVALAQLIVKFVLQNVNPT